MEINTLATLKASLKTACKNTRPVFTIWPFVIFLAFGCLNYGDGMRDDNPDIEIIASPPENPNAPNSGNGWDETTNETAGGKVFPSPQGPIQSSLLAIDSAPIGARGAYVPPNISSPLRGKYIAVGSGHGFRGPIPGETNQEKRLQRDWHWDRASSSSTTNASGTNGKVYNSKHESVIEPHAIVEDYINSEITRYLNEFLRNAGAQTSQVRELSRQAHEVSLCAGSQGYKENGLAHKSQNLSAMAGRLCSGSANYRYMAGDLSGQSYIEYSLRVPVDGSYPVYYHFRDGTDRAQNVPVRIEHTGGLTNTIINMKNRAQTNGGYGSPGLRYQVVYLGTYSFSKDKPAVIRFYAKFPADKILVADTVRLGGGMDSIPIEGVMTGEERYKSSAYQYQKFLGRPSSVTKVYANGNNEDVTTRPHAANYENADLFISVHNNATGQAAYPYDHSTQSGTMVIYQYGDATSFKAIDNESRSLALKMKYRLIDTLRQYWDADWKNFNWGDNGFNGNYGETRAAKMPSALIEVGFFTHPKEIRALRDERFIKKAAMGIYRGIAQYLGAGWSPLEVMNVRAINLKNGSFALEWDAPKEGPSATYYLVRTAIEEKGFDSGSIAKENKIIFTNVPHGSRFSFTVQAGNANGLSLPSAEVSIRTTSQDKQKVLIINDFERLDDVVNSITDYERSQPMGYFEKGNTKNYSRFYERAISHSGFDYNVDSGAHSFATEKEIDPHYQMVIWYTGLAKNAGSPYNNFLSSARKIAVENYLQKGGHVVFSGANAKLLQNAMQTAGFANTFTLPFHNQSETINPIDFEKKVKEIVEAAIQR